MPDDEELAEVIRREQRLLDPAVRGRRDDVEELLHPDFVELGASGRVWDRAGTVAALERAPEVPGRASEVSAVALADDVVLVTYRIRSGQGGSLRSSVWTRSSGQWRLRFHQGTPLRRT